MPTDLYVYLRGGRGDTLLTAVTTTPTVETKTIVSAPYRDLGHRGLANGSTGDGLDVVVLSGSGIDGMKFDPPEVTIGGAAPAAVKTGVTTGTLTPNTEGHVVSVPDNVSHVPPRQVDLLVSYWKFVCSDGIDKFFPVADVIGWGPTART
jgi:hypothetical protein